MRSERKRRRSRDIAVEYTTGEAITREVRDLRDGGSRYLLEQEGFVKYGGLQVIALWAAFFLLNLRPAEAKEGIEPSSLLERAADLSDLRSAGTPFRLHAKVELTQTKGQPVSGNYILIWVSEEQWREEIGFPGYHRIRIGNSGTYWQQRTTDFEPDRIFQLTQAMDFVGRLRTNGGHADRKIKRRKQDGQAVNCVGIHPTGFADQESCFSADQGTLVREHLPRGEANGQSEVSAREYSNFVSLGGKLFPSSLRVLTGDKPIISLTVDELGPSTELNPSSFAPPSNAEAWKWCSAPAEPQPLEERRPRYPEKAKTSRITGLVRIYAVIEVDGKLSHLTLLHSPDAELSTATMDALKLWKYKPRSCNGSPIRMETLIDVIFSLVE